jgi:hypothetical protein
VRGVRISVDSAAYASNWRTIVATEAAMATVVFAGGIALVAMASAWGWVLATLGLVYGFFAGGRAVKWRRLRREAGL